MMKIAIVDYGLGNIHSVQNALSFIGASSRLESEPKELKNYDKVILPGVGAYGDAMYRLKKTGMDKAVKDFASSNKPLLGVCLGLHLLFKKGYEFGEREGLGILDGEIVKFDESKFNEPLKIPHMGWNTCEFCKQSALNAGLKKSEYFYFVHSYHVICDESLVLATTNYGYDFISAVESKNIYAFQPHPEKSHNVGLKILKNFVEL